MQSTRMKWTPPNYPYLGGGAVSAKIVNMAEGNGTFAIEVALAVIAHRENGKQVSFRKTMAGTVITANVGEEAVSILADESRCFPGLQHRKVGGF